MKLYLDSKKIFQTFGLTFDDITFDGAVKVIFGLIDLNKFDAIIFTLEHSFRNQLVIEKANRLGIPVFLIVDGVYEWSNTFNNPKLIGKPLLRGKGLDYVIMACDSTTKRFLNLGIDNLIQFQNPRVFGKSEVFKDLLEMDEKNHFELLITTAKTAYFTEKEKERLISLLKDVKKSVEYLGVKYITRIYDQSLIEECGFDAKNNFIEGSFCEVVSQVGAVLTTPSSISMEAMKLNRRVAHLLYRDVPITIQSAWNIHQSIDLNETLSELCSSKRSIRDEYQEIYFLNLQEDSLSPQEVNTTLDNILKERKAERKTFSIFERLDFLWRLPYEVFFK